jgi:hypothetical protein
MDTVAWRDQEPGTAMPRGCSTRPVAHAPGNDALSMQRLTVRVSIVSANSICATRV